LEREVTQPQTETDIDLKPGSFAEGYRARRENKTLTSVVVPDGMYALDNHAGKSIYYEVRTGKRQWAGYQFVSIMQGAPGRWRRLPIKQAEFRRQVLSDLAQDPKAAAIRFSKKFGICALCGSELKDPASRERGLGAECIKKFPAEADAA
jgi:hypothetical protein